MEIVLYSTGCPRCRVLEAKLKQKGVTYVECNDIKEMENKGIDTLPALSVDGTILDFSLAITWVNRLEV